MQVNDFVIHGTEGICKITDMVNPDFAQDKTKMYFLLSPLENATAKIYVPVDKAEARCRRLMTEAEAKELVDSIEHIEMIEIENDKERERIYKETLQKGDLRELIAVLKNIHIRRSIRTQAGKKNTAVDDKYFKLMERNLCGEIGFSLHLSEAEVKELLKEKI